MAKKVKNENGGSTYIDEPAAAESAPTEPAANGKPKLTKRERFLKYAPRRVQKVLNAFRQLGNVTNKGSYEYSEAEVAKIMDAITFGVTVLRNKFAGSKEVKEVFQL